MGTAERFLPQFGWYSLATLLERGASLLLLPLVALALTPAEYGELAVAMAAAALLLNIADAGLANGYLRHHDLAGPASAFATYTRALLGWSLAIVALYSALTGWQPLLLLAGLYALANLALYAQLTRLRIRGEAQLYARVSAAQAGLRLLLTALLLFAAGLKAPGVLLAFVLANALNAVWLWRHSAAGAWSTATAKRFLVFGMPLAVTALLFTCLELLDRLLLQWLGAGSAAIGIYDFNYKLAGLMLLFIAPLQLLWPEFLYRRDRAVTQDMYHLYVLLLTVAWLALALPGHYLLQLPRFTAYRFEHDLLPFLGAGFWLYGLYPFCAAELQRAERTAGIALAALGGVLANVAGVLLFTPLLGLTGTAAATVLGYYVTNCALLALRAGSGLPRLVRLADRQVLALVMVAPALWACADTAGLFLQLAVVAIFGGAGLWWLLPRAAANAGGAGKWPESLRAQAEYQQQVRGNALRAWFQARVRAFYRSQLPPEAVVLDLGGGRCRVTAGLPARLHLSADPLAAEAGRAPAPVRGLVATGENQPLRAGSVDIVLANSIMHAVRDLPAVLAEVRRVLRPGGMFLLQEAVGMPLSTSHLRSFTAQSLQSELEQAGLTVTRRLRRGRFGLSGQILSVVNSRSWLAPLLLPLFALAWYCPAPRGGEWLLLVKAVKR